MAAIPRAMGAAVRPRSGRVFVNRPERPCKESPATAEQNSDALRVREALAQLPSDRRTLLALHYLHDLSVAEIASTLRIPIGTVKSRMHAARAQLKGALNQQRREPCPS